MCSEANDGSPCTTVVVIIELRFWVRFRFRVQVRPLLTSPVALAAYEYKDGQIGCMMNPIGKPGRVEGLGLYGLRCQSAVTGS